MPGTSDMQDPTFRAALERAEQQLDEGDYTGAAQTCAETYLLLLGRHPELLPPENVELVPPPPEAGRRKLVTFPAASPAPTPPGPSVATGGRPRGRSLSWSVRTVCRAWRWSSSASVCPKLPATSNFWSSNSPASARHQGTRTRPPVRWASPHHRPGSTSALGHPRPG